ncbi:MAG TPA: glycosyltransferase [Gemmatimonadales bacterium]|nr:glycosyltransferase [Gemmatimonadales bacterium]
MSEPPTPSLGIILATDRYETIRPVIRHLQRQTIRDQLEIVMVGDASLPGGLDAAELAGFARVHVETVDSLDPISAARAAGVRAARAPLVFIGETHTYAHPTWAEALVRAQADGRAGLIPGFGNANPASPLSWAIFLLDYGQWLYLMPAGESGIAPTHNGAFRREVLLDLGENLDHALHQGDHLTLLLQSANHRMYFEPSARIDHLNVARWGPWVRERFLGGQLLAGRRAARWSWARRLIYFCGAPLIPMLLVSRLREVLAVARQGGLLPRGTAAAVFLGGTVSAVGEMFGYLVGDRPDVEPQMMEFELHKVQYAARGAPAAG